MSGTADPVVAIVERMMEQLQKEHPRKDGYKRKPKKEPKTCRVSRRKRSSPLH